MAPAVLSSLKSSLPTMNWPFHSRRSFRRLRSFHLPIQNVDYSAQPHPQDGTKADTPSKKVQSKEVILAPPPTRAAPLRPIRRSTLNGRSVVVLALIISAFFIGILCFCFLGADIDEEYFSLMLRKTAQETPGVSNFDPDIRSLRSD
jgi:hypothetical protein